MYKRKNFQIISNFNKVEKKYFSVPVTHCLKYRNYKISSMVNLLTPMLRITMRLEILFDYF